MALLVDENRLKVLLTELYVKGWTHGSWDIPPDCKALVETYLEECKKST